jgi:hypothetical protein
MIARREDQTNGATPAPLPDAVTENLASAERHYLKCIELTGEIIALEPDIARMQAELDELKAKHTRLGKVRTDHHRTSAAHHEMALDHCKKYGYGPMPGTFEEVTAALELQAARLQPVAIGDSNTQSAPIFNALTDPDHQVA